MFRAVLTNGRVAEEWQIELILENQKENNHLHATHKTNTFIESEIALDRYANYTSSFGFDDSRRGGA